MLRSIRDQDHILAKAVQDHAYHGARSPQRDSHLLPAVHSKMLLSIDGNIKGGVLLCALKGFVRNSDLRHLIHTVVAHLPVRAVVRHQIVVVTVPDQAVWGDGVLLSPAAQDLFSLEVIVKILKGDGAPGGDGGMEPVHIEVNALIHHLDPAADKHLPL